MRGISTKYEFGWKYLYAVGAGVGTFFGIGVELLEDSIVVKVGCFALFVSW